MSHYPRNYVRLSQKNIREHILETVERFEEDFTDEIRIHRPLHAVVQVGDPIPVGSRRDREAAVDPVMEALRVQLGGHAEEALRRIAAHLREGRFDGELIRPLVSYGVPTRLYLDHQA